MIGRRDELLGEAIRACVVLDDGAALSELEVIRECRTKLENFMVPRDVVFVTESPHTESGEGGGRRAFRENRLRHRTLRS